MGREGEGERGREGDKEKNADWWLLVQTTSNKQQATSNKQQTRRKTMMNLFAKKNNLQFPTSDQSTQMTLMLKQTSFWSKAVLWTVVGVTSFGIGWASVAEIEQTIPATGQLKPQASVKEVQTPVGGVVTKVHVKSGDRVEPGDLLLTFDTTTTTARLKSLNNERDSLTEENKYYELLLKQTVQTDIATPANVSAQIAQLGKERSALMAENSLFEAQLGVGGANLTAEQRDRLNALQSQTDSRVRAAELEVAQLAEQLNQNQVQLADAREQLSTARKNLTDIQKRNNSSLTSTQQSLATEKKILAQMKPLAEQGAIATLQYEKQLQAVNKLTAELSEKQASGSLDYNTQLQEIQSRQADVERLTQERNRVQLDLEQSREELKNTSAGNETNVRSQMANNEKRIAEIDSQLTKTIVENKKRLAQIDSEVSQANLNLEYQQLRASEAGVIFDLQASKTGFVANPSQTLLKIVPNDALVAEVYITSKDIGFVKEGMSADVRIDSFDFSEFGDIQGKLVSIGKDALEPDEKQQFYRFPASIRLESQTLAVNERELSLRSGMTVSVNIVVKEKRRVISLLAESLVEKLDSLKGVD
jgi:HlyD family secretion protein